MSDTARVALNGTFTAPEIEQAIAELAQARSALQPAVPSEPPMNLDASILTQSNAQFRIRTRIDGGLRIWLRNEGVGWLTFELDAAAREELRTFLARKPGHTHQLQ